MEAMMAQAHGGLDPVELRLLGLDARQVLDFSASVHPLGPPPGVRRAMAQVDVAAYPDRRCTALREALAARAGVGLDMVLAGNGATELIYLLARGLLAPGKRGLIFGPTFGEYATACITTGATVVEVRAEEETGFVWDAGKAAAAVRRERPSLAFLCNPNNPTGTGVDRRFVEEVADGLGDAGVLVLDEAYAQFADAPWDAAVLLKRGNIVLLRSMTKDYGLAGVRLGYMLAAPELIRRAAAQQPSWSVSGLAQAAGIAALAEEEHVAKGREIVRRSKTYLLRALGRLGYDVTPSQANFLLVRVGCGEAMRQALLRRGIAVRDGTSFGLSEHIRIGVRRLGECRRLIAAMEEVQAHG